MAVGSIAALLGAIAIIAVAVGQVEGRIAPGFAFSVEAAEGLVRSAGAWGAAVSIGLMVAHSFVPFPAEILAVANGMVFGVVGGTAVTWVGAMLGAALAFGLGRALGRPFVKVVLPGRQWDRLEDWSLRRGGMALLMARLIPLIAFNLINYAAALTAISWWTFLWATGLGILPLTILVAGLGASAASLPWWSWTIGLGLAVGAWLVVRRTGGLASAPSAALDAPPDAARD